MLKKIILAGLIGVAATPAVAIGKITNNTYCLGNESTTCIEDKNGWISLNNRIGLPVSYSKNVAADLWTIHGLDAKKMIPNMYGTSFTISKIDFVSSKTNRKFMKFVFQTNDSRDKPIRWDVLV